MALTDKKVKTKEGIEITFSHDYRSTLQSLKQGNARKTNTRPDAIKLRTRNRKRRFLLLQKSPNPAQEQELNEVAAKVFAIERYTSVLTTEEMLQVLTADNASEYAVLASVNLDGETIEIIKGDMQSLRVPFSIFKPTANGIAPDFGDFEIIDCGQALRMGEYEAVFDAVLYECDKAYRKSLRQTEKSLGACLYRARAHKGLRQDQFPEVSARDIGRIERGETKTPKQKTLAHILKILDIKDEKELLYY